jgi:hypothetical protein
LISREEGVILEGERGRQQESDDMAKIIPMERANSISRAKVDMISKTIPDGSREKFMRMEREMDHRNRSK